MTVGLWNPPAHPTQFIGFDPHREVRRDAPLPTIMDPARRSFSTAYIDGACQDCESLLTRQRAQGRTRGESRDRQVKMWSGSSRDASVSHSQQVGSYLAPPTVVSEPLSLMAWSTEPSSRGRAKLQAQIVGGRWVRALQLRREIGCVFSQLWKRMATQAGGIPPISCVSLAFLPVRSEIQDQYPGCGQRCIRKRNGCVSHSPQYLQAPQGRRGSMVSPAPSGAHRNISVRIQRSLAQMRASIGIHVAFGQGGAGNRVIAMACPEAIFVYEVQQGLEAEISSIVRKALHAKVFGAQLERDRQPRSVARLVNILRDQCAGDTVGMTVQAPKSFPTRICRRCPLHMSR